MNLNKILSIPNRRMKRKSMLKNKSKTRKYKLYGGQGVAPAAAAPAVAGQGGDFDPWGYSRPVLYDSLNNYLQAAYSMKLASAAIKDTSVSQNMIITGTRNLQLDSANSYQTAATTIQTSLDRLYQAFTNNLPPLSAPPPGFPPHALPPYTYTPPTNL